MPSPDVKSTSVDAGGVQAEWVTVEASDPARVLFFIHGGGYVFGSPETHRGLVAALCRETNSRALSIDYRLAPEHPHPAALQDALTSYRWLLDQGIAPESTVTVGDSAGAGLSLSMLVAARDQNLALPAAAVCLSPWVDLASEGESLKANAGVDPFINPALSMSNARRYVGGDGDLYDPAVSPLYADLRGLPPLLVMVGTAETLFDDSIRLVERARRSGTDTQLIIGDGMIHGYPFFFDVFPEAREGISQIGEFVSRTVGW